MSTGQKWWADAYEEYSGLLRRYKVPMRGGDGLGGFDLSHLDELRERDKTEIKQPPSLKSSIKEEDEERAKMWEM